MAETVFKQEGNMAPAFFVKKNNGCEILNDTRDIMYVATRYTLFNSNEGTCGSAFAIQGFILYNGSWIESDIHYNMYSVEDLVATLDRCGAFRKAIKEIRILENKKQ